MSVEPMTGADLDRIDARASAASLEALRCGYVSQQAAPVVIWDVPALVAEVRRLRAVVDRARELVAASCHTDDCAASHHQHCGAECDYDDSTPEECARAFREGCECGLGELCDALGVEVDRG